MVAASLVVTVVAVAGGVGALPSGASDTVSATTSAFDPVTEGDSSTSERDASAGRRPSSATTEKLSDTGAGIAAVTEFGGLPEASGTGKRVVFSESRQRVWLVDGDGKVLRSYLVSGSTYDNLEPGTYSVYSRSRHAVGIDDSGTMEYFVRFTQGDQGAAIGFHSIPVNDGKPVQTLDQLGTPLSHGCIRQERSTAIALWDFAPIGTKVVVTA